MKENLAIPTQQILSQLAVRNDVKEALHELFNSSLHQDPRERTDLLEELGIQDMADQLYWTDYRVRAHIAQCLLDDPSSSPSIASQVALCYHIGFGVARDEKKVQGILAQSKKKQKSFEKIVASLQYPRGVIETSTTRALRKTGFLSSSDFSQLYRQHGKLDEAEMRLGQETKDLISACGSSHPLVHISKEMLSKVYSAQGHWKEAEKLELEIVEVRKAEFGLSHPDTLASMGNLAWTLASQDRLKEAEDMMLEVVEICQAQLGSDDSLTLTSMANLAAIFTLRDRGEEAEKLKQQVIEARKAKLGEDHPDTLMSITTLASAFVRQGRFQEAEKLDLKVLELRKVQLGVNHPNTLMSMADVAFVWKCQGRDADA
ncbi:hypothetical protein FALBO_14135 [Fusarium albosuccineum]|uniref:Kinesin light chain n=1 Tax=Fusarium albosuccineum TaxID=1237068 RepID=A0A8H4L0R8_9HYPO|nr:hypothetical protein FALBO_14135 [Fusarium albosuccineum]